MAAVASARAEAAAARQNAEAAACEAAALKQELAAIKASRDSLPPRTMLRDLLTEQLRYASAAHARDKDAAVALAASHQRDRDAAVAASAAHQRDRDAAVAASAAHQRDRDAAVAAANTESTRRRSSLDPPDAWGGARTSTAPQPTKRVRLAVSSSECQVVTEAFLKTLVPGVPHNFHMGAKYTILSVERIQNEGLWKGYQVKRQSVLAREAAHWDQPESRFVKTWLFHGTDEQTAPKIIEQGFNRSFCGKHATRFGKGVYFARDASYSVSPTYSAPNAAGEQRILLCRVVAGEFCLGTQDCVAPDERPGFRHVRYDSTVDRLDFPGIFVTYHDAQAYPEYLVTFRCYA